MKSRWIMSDSISPMNSWSVTALDYQEFYRQLPYIGVLKPDIYNKDSK